MVLSNISTLILHMDTSQNKIFDVLLFFWLLIFGTKGCFVYSYFVSPRVHHFFVSLNSYLSSIHLDTRDNIYCCCLQNTTMVKFIHFLFTFFTNTTFFVSLPLKLGYIFAQSKTYVKTKARSYWTVIWCFIAKLFSLHLVKN